jgi:integrase/recombinase XerD
VSLGKQAKPLTKGQIDAVVSYLAKTRHPIRDRLIFLFSIRAGLRAREIAPTSRQVQKGPPAEIFYYLAIRQANSTTVAPSAAAITDAGLMSGS